MKKGFFGALVALLAGTGYAVAQEPVVFSEPRMFATDPDGIQPRVWGGAEYLLWFLRDARLPTPLVTSGDPNRNNPGALNDGGTPVFGGKLFPGNFSGVRATLGAWLDSEATIGVESSGFVLPTTSRTFAAASNARGNPVLAFRYLDAPFQGLGTEDAFQASIQDMFTGSLAVRSSTSLWGTEANAVFALPVIETVRIQGLFGFRFVDLTDNLGLAWRSQALPGSTVPFLGNNFDAPSTVTSADRFRARNEFYAGQFGLRGEYALGRAFVALGGKVALGNNHEVLQIAGSSSLIQPGGAVTRVNLGQFAGPSNIGTFNMNQFAVAPEVNIKLGADVTPRIRAFVGYDFMYLSNVVRANNQLDLIVDTRADPVNGGFVTPIPKTAFPRMPFSQTDFWAHGVNFGLEIRF